MLICHAQHVPKRRLSGQPTLLLWARLAPRPVNSQHRRLPHLPSERAALTTIMHVHNQGILAAGLHMRLIRQRALNLCRSRELDSLAASLRSVQASYGRLSCRTRPRLRRLDRGEYRLKHQTKAPVIYTAHRKVAMKKLDTGGCHVSGQSMQDRFSPCRLILHWIEAVEDVLSPRPLQGPYGSFPS